MAGPCEAGCSKLITKLQVNLKEHLEHSNHQVDGNCHCHHQQVHCHHCHQKLTTGLGSILVGLVFNNTRGQNSTRLKWPHEPKTQACSCRFSVEGISIQKYTSGPVRRWEWVQASFPSDTYDVRKRFPRLCTKERILRLHLEQVETLFKK